MWKLSSDTFMVLSEVNCVLCYAVNLARERAVYTVLTDVCAEKFYFQGAQKATGLGPLTLLSFVFNFDVHQLTFAYCYEFLARLFVCLSYVETGIYSKPKHVCVGFIGFSFILN
jgi:hypothetical protein